MIKQRLIIFGKAVLAGMAIGIGGDVYLTLQAGVADATRVSMFNETIGALMFAVGLYAICVLELYLFTGKVGYALTTTYRRSYAVDLVVGFLGNYVGAIGLALAVRQMKLTKLQPTLEAMVLGKLEKSWLTLLIAGILCGMLVYIAVEGYKRTKNPLIILLSIATFILCGYEHCVADMFYFAAAGLWTWQVLLVILVVAVGNSLGAWLVHCICQLTTTPKLKKQ